jgi:hypothetical protein
MTARKLQLAQPHKTDQQRRPPALKKTPPPPRRPQRTMNTLYAACIAGAWLVAQTAAVPVR